MNLDDTPAGDDALSSSNLSADEELQAGTIFDGRYEILALSGKGAGGAVYKAKHLVLSQLVAIKIINPLLLDRESAVKRFQKEAVLLSSFEHPNIVRFHAFGRTGNGRYYIVLEFLEGKSLSEILQSGRVLPVDQALSLAKDVCHGLAYAHERGIVHRDIKPANIMVPGADGAGQAKIMDFGIYKEIDSPEQALTSTGQFLGSANYMSPEQCRGQSLDQRSDIYSLGCLIYETLSGFSPMEGDNDLVTMFNHINKDIKSIEMPDSISQELSGIILKCMAKDPADRFSSADELSQALENVQTHTLGKAKKADLFKFLLVASAIVLVIASILAAGWQWRAWNPRSESESEKLKYSSSLFRQPPSPTSDALDTFRRQEEWLAVNLKRHADPEQLADAWLRMAESGKMTGKIASQHFADQVEKALQEEIRYNDRILNQDKIYIGRPAHEKLDKIEALASIQIYRQRFDEARQTIKLLSQPFPGEGKDDIGRKRFECLFKMRILLFEQSKNEPERQKALLERINWCKEDGLNQQAAADLQLLKESYLKAGRKDEARRCDLERRRLLRQKK